VTYDVSMEPLYAPQDVGLGTAFERLAVYRRVRTWANQKNIRTALEGPVDGMAGMPGLNLLPLARSGTDITVVLPDHDAIERVREVYARGRLSNRLTAIVADSPPDGATYDLVLTYNPFALVDDWRTYLGDILARSRKWAIVSVSHPTSYGVYISRGLKALRREQASQLYEHEAAAPATLEPELERHGKIADMAYMDCPWWPDLFVTAGQSLAQEVVSAVPLVGAKLAARLAPSSQPGPGPFDYPPDAYPFSIDDEPRELVEAMKRHPYFDDRSRRIASVFAHLRAYLLDVSDRPS
jgi:hypothetical protein